MLFSFPHLTPAAATLVAAEVRVALAKSGVQTGAVALQRERAETQDLGTIVAVAQPYVDQAGVLVNFAALSVMLYEIITRNRCVVRIRTGNGEVEIGPGTVTADNLRLVLDSLSKQAVPSTGMSNATKSATSGEEAEKQSQG